MQHAKKSYFSIGEKVTLVSEHNLFTRPLGSPITNFDELHFVEIKIIEEKEVVSNCKSSKKYFGYKAEGSDGFKYVCQYDTFDRIATSPYKSWMREYVEGEHYETKSNGDILIWNNKGNDNFQSHLHAWDITFDFITLNLDKLSLLKYLALRFPRTEHFVCNESFSLFDNKHGPQYKAKSCYMCKYIKGLTSSKTEKTDKNTSE